MLHCIGYFSLVPSRNGLLYPLYSRDGLNIPFVQEIDRNGIVTSFIEFSDLDDVFHVKSSGARKVTVGDHGLFAYLRLGITQEHDFSSIVSGIRSNVIDIDDPDLAPLTRLGLSRISDQNPVKHQEIYLNYLRSCSVPTGRSAMLNRADQRLLTSQNDWWSAIYAAEFGESEISASFESATAEDIIYWLYDNDVNEDWKNICAGLLRKVLFDDRISDIVSKFISVSDNFEEFDLKSNIIVGRAMELYMRNTNAGGDFIDIMYDRIVDGQIFYLGTHLLPIVMQSFISAVIQEQEDQGEDYEIIDSLLDYFESDVIVPKMVPVIINILFDCNLSSVYPENSFYKGISRFDRFIEIYRSNPAIRLWLHDESLIETMNEIVEEVGGFRA